MTPTPGRDLYGFFRRRFPADPARVFIELADGRTIRYAELDALTGRFANLLVRLGVQPGDRVAAQVDKSAAALLLYLATLRAGAVFLPLNAAYTAGEIRYFLGDAEPALFVCRPPDEAVLAPLALELGVRNLRTLGSDDDGSLALEAAACDGAFADVPRAGDDLAAILYTSGTTGRSKGAMLTHDNLRSNAEALCAAWRWTAADRLLHALPIFHTHGLFVATHVTLAAGASMILLPRFDAPELLRHMPRATVLMGVPTFYTRLLAAPAFTRDLAAHMRLFVSGSAPLSAETHREFRARTGHAILERYGMTETNMNTSNPYDGERVPGSVGAPLPGVRLRIADPASGRVLGTGEVGVIELEGPNVFKGYWRNPAKTAEEFRADGFFVTGDLGRVDERGYVWIVGRARDLIISGGLNVYPAEVETVLDELPGIAESAVIGVPHPDLGEGVVAVVTPAPGGAADEAAVIAALADRLARYKQPKRVFFVAELPRNAMGKVQKQELRTRYAATFATT
jgi:malonyl-CoA/methylmalonyl-CoA synthetase